MTKFTQQGVERMKSPKKTDKPNRKDKIHTIRRGLALDLRVSYSGSKTWRVLHYVNGRPRYEIIGTFPAVSVSEAYKKVSKFDPEAASKNATAGSFREVAQDFIVNYVDVEGLRSKREIIRCLDRYVYPQWGSRRFLTLAELTSPSCGSHQREAWPTSGQHGARHHQ